MTLDAVQQKLMQATAAANRAVAAKLPLANQDDFEAAARGKIADRYCKLNFPNLRGCL
jgi:alkyl sulfatase BDS1-like metallo-beta-lactamase superfamily hydrolase